MRIVMLLVNLLIFLVPAALATQIARRLSKSSRDEWMLLAFVPVAPLVFWGVRIAWDVSRA